MRVFPPGIWGLLCKHKFGTFGPPAGATLILFIEEADRVDFLSGVISGDSVLVKGIHWFAEHPFWFVVLLMLWAVGYPLYFWRQYTKGLHKKFHEDWRAVESQRQMLRDRIAPAYAKWRNTLLSFTAVDRFVEKSGFPSGLPFNEGEMRVYATRAKDEWGGNQKQLLDFCIALYPSEGESVLLESDELTQFSEARMKFSKFCDEWGRECFDEGSIRENDILSRLRASELTLLTYLEVALALKNNDDLLGKQGLFKLARVATRKWRHPAQSKRIKKHSVTIRR